MKEDVIMLYQTTVYGIALTRTRSKHDADDVFQEVFIIYFKKERHFESEAHRKAWFIRTTINCCHAFIRKFKSDFLPFHEDMVPPHLFDDTAFDALYLALLQLKPQERLVLHLHYIEGYQTDEIAALLQIKGSACRMRLKRARASLKSTLKGGLYEDAIFTDETLS